LLRLVFFSLVDQHDTERLVRFSMQLGRGDEALTKR
jgi:hypothetical protein